MFVNYKLNLLFNILFINILTSCTDNTSKTSFKLVLNFKNSKQDSIYIKEIDPTNIIPVDSLYLDALGKCEKNITIGEPTFLRIEKKNNQFITIFASPGETIEIKADPLTMNYSVKGSIHSQLIKQLADNNSEILNSIDSMKNIYFLYRDSSNFLSIKQQLDSLYVSLFPIQKKFIRQFIQKYDTSFASLIALYSSIGKERILNPNEDYYFFFLVDKGLMKNHPKSKHTIEYHKKFIEIEQEHKERKIIEAKLSIGNYAPDITLNSIDNKQYSISQFKGKNLLIQFWSSSCKPCRNINSQLNHLYSKLKKHNTEIYSISIDDNYQDWMYSSKQDNIKWINVSDLMGWNSPVVKIYNIQGVPTNFLIDTNGIIIAKNISINELKNKLISNNSNKKLTKK